MAKTLLEFLEDFELQSSRLREADLFTGSKVYTTSKDKLNVLTGYLRSLGLQRDTVDRDDVDLSAADIRLIRRMAEEVRAYYSQYLDRHKKVLQKDGKLDEIELFSVKTETSKRIRQVHYGLEQIDGFVQELDEREKAIHDKTFNSIQELNTEVENIYNKLSDNTLGSKGSKEYKKIEFSLRRMRELLNRADQAGKTELKDIDPVDLQEIIEFANTASHNVDLYTKNKAGKDVNEYKEPTKGRIRAVGFTKDLLSALSPVLIKAARDYENTKAEPSEDLSAESEIVKNRIADSKVGVHFESTEFKEAEKAYEEYAKVISRIATLGDEAEMNSHQLFELHRAVMLARHKIDTYLNKKRTDAEEITDVKTIRRMEAMRAAKNSIIKSAVFLDQKEEQEREAHEDLTKEDFQANRRETMRELENAKIGVHFGSKAYDEGVEAYRNATVKINSLFEKDAYKEFSVTKLNREVKNLRLAMVKISTYISGKGYEGNLGPKTQKRVDAMYKAHADLSAMVDKLSAQVRTLESQKNTYTDETYKRDFDERLEGITTKDLSGTKRTAAIAARDALQDIYKCGTLSGLGAQKIKGVRYALAALVLHERINGKGNTKDTSKYPANPKDYAKSIKQLAESEAFKKQFPDSALTPDYCREVATKPEIAAKESRKTFASISEINNHKKVVLKKALENPEEKKDDNNPEKDNIIKK